MLGHSGTMDGTIRRQAHHESGVIIEDGVCDVKFDHILIVRGFGERMQCRIMNHTVRWL